MKKRNKKNAAATADAEAGTTPDAEPTAPGAATEPAAAEAGPAATGDTGSSTDDSGGGTEEVTQPNAHVPTFDEGPDTEVGSGVVPEAATPDEWDGPTTEAAASEMAALAAASTAIDAGAEVEAALESPAATPGRLESVLESLLFASDRALTVAELKRLVGERDTAKVTAALEALRARRGDEQSGIQVASVAGGWQLRTHPDNAAWVSRLITGRPQRLTRAMLETLSIVAYRQPITRPEIDDIRGVDCGPVLKTLLDRALVRMIGKREEVGRPILYGTTPEFLRVFSLSDLSELPTLREFHELGAAEMAKVDAEAPPSGDAAAAAAAPTPDGAAPAAPAPVPRRELDPDEDDELISELERAAAAAAKAAEVSEPTQSPPDGGAATTTD